MSGRFALVIGNSEYHDATLSRLKTPEADARLLAAALRDDAIGGFDDVQELINQDEGSIRRAISAFFTDKKPDDLLMLYFSGHGVLDSQGRLFLAVKDTQRSLLKATAIPASFVSENMDDCRSKRQVLVLDCCHSGAFARGTKGDAPAVTQSTFAGSGYGRVVLTASDSTQYALEGDQVIEQASLSLFTHYLLDGLNTGEADLAKDGWITLDEWYDYAYDRVHSETPDQTPRKWVYNQEGDLVIARNPRPAEIKPAELPEKLRVRLKSEYKPDRLEAVHQLESLLKGDDPALALAARAALEGMAADDDSLTLRGKASEVLTAYPAWLEARQAEIERLAREKAEAERLAKEQAQTERLASEKAEQERLEKEAVEARRIAREKAKQERLAKQQTEAQRLARENAEDERIATEQAQQQAEAERLAREKAEAERIAMEQAEARRMAQEKAEQERLAIERAEGERLARLNGLYATASAAAGARRWEEAQRIFTQLEREAPGYRDTPAQLSRIALELAKPASVQPPAATGVMKAAAPARTVWKPALVIALGWGFVSLLEGFLLLVNDGPVNLLYGLIAGAILGGSLLLSFQAARITLQPRTKYFLLALWALGVSAMMWGYVLILGFEHYDAFTLGVLEGVAFKYGYSEAAWLFFGGLFLGTAILLERALTARISKDALLIFAGWAIGFTLTIPFTGWAYENYGDYSVSFWIVCIVLNFFAGAIGGGWMHWYLKRMAPARTEQFVKAGDENREGAGIKPPAGKLSYWQAIGYHLLLGYGLFKVAPNLKRKWIYPAAAIVVILDYSLAVLDVHPFHDDFGVYVFLIALGIYVLGFVDTTLTLRKQDQTVAGGAQPAQQTSSAKSTTGGWTLLRIGIVLASLAAALFYFNVGAGYGELKYFLAGSGYLVLVTALYLPQLRPYRRWIRLAFIGYIILILILSFTW